MRVAPRLPAALAFSVLAASCSFEFPRLDGVEPGDIVGKAIQDDTDDPAAFARIEPAGVSRPTRALADGAFVVRGLPAGSHALRFAEDTDGDGFLERGTWRSVSLRNADGVLTSILLGEVRLEASATIRGRVLDPDGAGIAGARVIAYRTSADVGDADAGVTLPSDTETVTTADGSFILAGVVPGVARVFAVARSADGDVLSAESLALEIPPSGDIDVGDLVAARTADEPRDVQVKVTIGVGADEDTVRVLVHRSNDPTGPAVVDQEITAGVDNTLSLPIDIYDVIVVERGVQKGGLRGVPSIASVGGVVRWSILLDGADACDVDSRDRDADGNPSIPLDRMPDCAAACANASGSAQSTTTCALDGATFDCNDDGDDQNDPAESACFGSCTTSDGDGDGVCTGADADPCCAGAVCLPACSSGGEGEGEGEGEAPFDVLQLAANDHFSSVSQLEVDPTGLLHVFVRYDGGVDLGPCGVVEAPSSIGVVRAIYDASGACAGSVVRFEVPAGKIAFEASSSLLADDWLLSLFLGGTNDISVIVDDVQVQSLSVNSAGGAKMLVFVADATGVTLRVDLPAVSALGPPVGLVADDGSLSFLLPLLVSEADALDDCTLPAPSPNVFSYGALARFDIVDLGEGDEIQCRWATAVPQIAEQGFAFTQTGGAAFANGHAYLHQSTLRGTVDGVPPPNAGLGGSGAVVTSMVLATGDIEWTAPVLADHRATADNEATAIVADGSQVFVAGTFGGGDVSDDPDLGSRSAFFDWLSVADGAPLAAPTFFTATRRSSTSRIVPEGAASDGDGGVLVALTYAVDVNALVGAAAPELLTPAAIAPRGSASVLVLGAVRDSVDVRGIAASQGPFDFDTSAGFSAAALGVNGNGGATYVGGALNGRALAGDVVVTAAAVFPGDSLVWRVRPVDACADDVDCTDGRVCDRRENVCVEPCNAGGCDSGTICGGDPALPAICSCAQVGPSRDVTTYFLSSPDQEPTAWLGQGLGFPGEVVAFAGMARTQSGLVMLGGEDLDGNRVNQSCVWLAGSLAAPEWLTCTNDVPDDPLAHVAAAGVDLDGFLAFAFGGETDGGFSAVTLVFSEGPNTWSEVTSAIATAPTARAAATLTGFGFGRALLFGGRDASGALGDAYIFNGNTYAPTVNIGAGPSPRFGHAATTVFVDTSGDGFPDPAVLVAGGVGVDGVALDDVWLLERAFDTNQDGVIELQWAALGALPQGPRTGVAMAATNAGVITFGGEDERGPFEDTWRAPFAVAGVAPFRPLDDGIGFAQAPSPRAGAALGFDGVRVVLHGGVPARELTCPIVGQ